MSEPLRVGVALSARAWRGSLQRHCRDHESDVMIRLLHQGAESLDGSIEVLVVDDDTSWLSAPFVAQARSAGVVVLGLFDPNEADGFGRSSLGRMGVELIASADLDTCELLDTIRRHRPDPDVDRRFAGMLSGIAVDPEPGRIVAVGGPAGAGATEVSLMLAALWPSGRPLVIDVDETHPTLARRLGLALHPHLLSAVDAHRHEILSLDAADASTAHSGMLRDCLARPVLPDRALNAPIATLGSTNHDADRFAFDVIAGLVTRDDWTLARPDDVVAMVERAAAEWPAVFVRLGPQLEDLSRHVGRYELSRRCAGRAGHLVGVCDATASGLLRFVDWLVDALPLMGDRPVDVVVNRSPRSPSHRGQLVEQLRSIAGDRIANVVCAPVDGRVERAAWDGTMATKGGFRKALGALEFSVSGSVSDRRITPERDAVGINRSPAGGEISVRGRRGASVVRP